LNSLPTVTLVSLSNWNATTNRTPEFSWDGYDADGDSLTYNFKIEEYKYIGSAVCSDDRSNDTLEEETYSPLIDLLCLYDNGYYYNWSVRANDGVNWGGWSSVRNLGITAEISINLSLAEVDFGSLIPGDIEDTSDGDPNSFVVENNGNVVTNISLNSSALWTEEPIDSAYYQFKANNVTEEEGAFNWLLSIVNWFDMPITGDVVGVAELNYHDDEDSAKVDIRLEVPSDENPGAKEAMVIFKGSLAE